jgi:transcriptional regulator with PAS, ATPase and Fis domain
VRQDGPFIALNCTAIPESLIESELFGIEKGVATGIDRRAGRIEQAHTGTLFLDEIGDMPLTSQAKILRVLEDREVLRVGAKKSLPVDIRIVTAANKDLRLEVQEGRFREDLYFRIDVARLHVPPLRERPDDIPLLLTSFLDIACGKMSRPALALTSETLELLTAYPWPGNVRELENEVERVAALSSSNSILPEDLSPHIRQAAAGHISPDGEGTTLLQDAERKLIQKVLQKVGNNKTQAARRLGISREGLRKKLKRFQIS